MGQSSVFTAPLFARQSTGGAYQVSATATLTLAQMVHVEAAGAAAADITLTLPTAEDAAGRFAYIHANTIGVGSDDIIVVSPESTPVINYTLTAVDDFVFCYSTGTKWIIITETST